MCQGSKPGTRGYTCGLWLLLHSLAARVEPATSGGAVWMSAVKCELPNPPPPPPSARARTKLPLRCCGTCDGWLGLMLLS